MEEDQAYQDEKDAAERHLKNGLALIRSKGINFESFCKRIKVLFTHPDIFSQDELVNIYNDYAYGCDVYFEEPEDFTKEYFQDWDISTHSTMLISKTHIWKRMSLPSSVEKEFTRKEVCSRKKCKCERYKYRNSTGYFYQRGTAVASNMKCTGD